MSNEAVKPESLRPVYEGFRRISEREQTDYLKYLGLVIDRKTGREKSRLVRFKAKLEREINFKPAPADLRKSASVNRIVKKKKPLVP
jgi:hypothetical protein